MYIEKRMLDSPKWDITAHMVNLLDEKNISVEFKFHRIWVFCWF